MIRKSLVVGILLLFMGMNLVSFTEAMRIDDSFDTGNVSNREIPSRSLSQSNGPLLFLTKFYGIGCSSSPLKIFSRGFRFTLAFEFTTPDSYVYIWFPKFSHTQWQEWNLTGPERYTALLFFGSVQQVDEKYIIEGRCLFLNMLHIP